MLGLVSFKKQHLLEGPALALFLLLASPKGRSPWDPGGVPITRDWFCPVETWATCNINVLAATLKK